MAVGSNVELSIGTISEYSVEIFASNQFASETGEIIIYDYSDIEVTRSSAITVYQSTISVTITGLERGRFYYARFYSETTGNFSTSLIEFRTLIQHKLYGSISGESTRISNLYGSVSDMSTRVNKLYGSAPIEEITSLEGEIRAGGAGNITAFNSEAFMNTISHDAEIMEKIEMSGFDDFSIEFYYGLDYQDWWAWLDSENFTFELSSTVYGPYTLNELGITINPTTSGTDYIDITVTTGMVHKTSLVHQGFGHLVFDFGTVYYKTNVSDPDSEIKSAKIQNLEEFNDLVNTDPFQHSWTATIDNGNVTVSNDSTNIIVGIDIGESVYRIPDSFLAYCTGLSQPIVIPSGVQEIGNNFLYACNYFDQTVSISSTVTSIGFSFLGFCDSFNKAIVIPDSVTSIGDSFMYHCVSYNSSLTLSSNLTSIGRGFMSLCSTFNQDINLPSSLIKIGTNAGTSFMYNCDSMVGSVNIGSLSANIIDTDTFSFSPTYSTSPAYTTGIKIAGSNRAAWLAKFPNSTTIPYRKLLDAGY